ncbi:WD40/YVTN repeat-like-containing domain-containing protein [Strongyloides ratti]|uniref:WD40/YVTN repeat-like-containing domain-containing protein n=1 Tax=Strongyloides ratti TaxID=34506 RepID=A0A090KWB6_STRRB|nr:WD40/YVTN repeat-like-containing domain-containing protein [Strongyloides ratti]CEF61785.1 WD40/YVTN repeat-like-containing domain-containing protein [Strongyloides ratti]
MFSNKKIVENIINCLPNTVDFGFTTVNIRFINKTNNYLIFTSQNGIVFPFLTSDNHYKCLPHIKFPTNSGKVTIVKVHEKLNCIGIGFDSGIVHILKLNDNYKHLKINKIHEGRSINDIVWSNDGEHLYVGDNCGHITIIIINWNTKIVQYKYLCIDGMPIIKIIINEKEENLFYITNYSLVCLNLKNKNKIERKVFDFEDDREELEYRGLIFINFIKSNFCNEINVIDKEGFVYIFEIYSGKLKRQYSLEGCKNIQNGCLISNNGIIFRENKYLRYFVFEEINGELILFLNSIWNVEECNHISSKLFNDYYDDENIYNIIDICYHDNEKILFCLIDPRMCIIFSENSKNNLFMNNLYIQESKKSEFILTTEILNFTALTTKQFIDKKMPHALAKLDKIKNVTSEKVVEKFEEAKEGKLNDYIELPDTSLKIIYPFNFFKIINYNREDYKNVCITKKLIKVKSYKKQYKQVTSITYTNEKYIEKEEVFSNLIKISDAIINNSRPIKNKLFNLSYETSIDIKTNYEYELEYQKFLIKKLPLSMEIKNNVVEEKFSPTSLIDISLHTIKPFSISIINNEDKTINLINTTKCDINNYINLSCYSSSWNFCSFPYQIHSFTISSNFLITTANDEWRCDFIELTKDKKWKKCTNYPGDIVRSNYSGTLLWKITKGKAFSPKQDILLNINCIFTNYCDWKNQTPYDYIYDVSFMENDGWYLTKQGPFVKMNLPSMGILYHAPIKCNKNIIFDKISASSNGVWILSTGKNTIYARVGLHKCQMGVEWIKVKSIKKIPYNIVSITLHATFAFALDSYGCLWMLPDVTKKNVLGSKKGWYKMYFDFNLPKNTILMSDVNVSCKGIIIKNGYKLFYTSSGFINAHQFFSFENEVSFYGFKRISNISSNEIILFHKNGDFYIFNILYKKYKIINVNFIENYNDNNNIEKKMMSNNKYIFFLHSSGTLWIYKKSSNFNYMFGDEWKLFHLYEIIGDGKMVTDFTLTNNILFFIINNCYLYKYDLLTQQTYYFTQLPKETENFNIFVSKTASIIWIGNKKKYIYYYYSLKNDNWIKINNNSYDELISKIVIGNNIVWGLSKKLRSLYYLENFDETSNPKGDKWRKVIDITILDIALNLDDGNELIILDKKGILKKHDIISFHIPFNESLNFTLPLSEKSIIYQEYISSFNINSSPLKNNIQSQDINIDDDTLNSISINSFLQIVPKFARKTISGVTSKIFNH